MKQSHRPRRSLNHLKRKLPNLLHPAKRNRPSMRRADKLSALYLAKSAMHALAPWLQRASARLMTTCAFQKLPCGLNPCAQNQQ